MKEAIRFFDEKKSWSLMKDKILGWYLKPYITKVSQFRKQIVIVDGFAGCGMYKDNSKGSPLIISSIIEDRNKSISANVIGVFVEKDPNCFKELKKNLKSYADQELAIVLLGDFEKIVPTIIKLASRSPMFFYIDPFGIKGLEFEYMERIFKRANISSTEVLVNFNYKTFLRESVALPDLTKKVMGGDYYEEILDNTTLEDDKKEEKIVQLYKDQYNKYFQYIGSCPVMYKDDQSAKYHLIFATSHFDGIQLMNNRMGDIYREFYSEGRLFSALPPEKTRDISYLEDEIMEIFRIQRITTRHQIKEALVSRLFMRYKEKDYGEVIGNLLKAEKVFSETGRTRINDKVRLSIRSFDLL